MSVAFRFYRNFKTSPLIKLISTDHFRTSGAQAPRLHDTLRTRDVSFRGAAPLNKIIELHK